MIRNVPKAHPDDYLARFREIISDPCNRLIRRVPFAGFVGRNNQNGREFIVMHNGLLVPRQAYYGRFADVLIVNRGVHEPQEELVFGLVMPEVPDGEPMIELGAYWGFYSAWFKRSHPTSDVFLIEPKVEHLAVGRETFALNGLTGNFFEGFIGVGGLDLSTFASQHGIGRIGVLHVDIQGAEEKFLSEIHHFFESGRIRFVFVSTHSQPIHEHCRSTIRAAGYQIIADADFQSDTYACDGLIVGAAPGVVFNPVRLWSRASGAAIDTAC